MSRLEELEARISSALGDSENVSKTKRRAGRPLLFGNDMMFVWKSIGVGDGCMTSRGRMNHFHAMVALSALKSDAQRFAWLVDFEKITARTMKTPMVVLAELGRLRNPALIRAMAERICEQKPDSARRAAEIIRRFRLKRQPAADVHGLLEVITGKVDEYRASHAGATPELCKRAVQQLVAVLDELQEATA